MVGFGAAVLLLAVAVDLAALYGRVGRFGFVPPPERPGETFLVVGQDSRAGLPPDRTRDLGTTAAMPGARADVAVLVHLPDEGPPVVLGLPRDLLVFTGGGIPRRLTVTLLGGATEMADALCRSVGVAVDHVLVVGFMGFERLVDAAGGVPVDVPAPVRDTVTGLDLPRAGRHELDGREALAYVRSRHPETLVDGAWAPVAEGGAARPDQALQVLRALAASIGPNPARAQRMAWAAAGAVTVDATTTARSLARLALALRSLDTERATPLPARTTETPVPVATLEDGAAAALRRIGAAVSRPSAPGRCGADLLHAGRPAVPRPEPAP